jgi:hypothetical protein
MSRSPLAVGVAALLVAAVPGIAGCSSDCPNCPGSPALVVVSPQTVSVLPGDTVQVAALVYDADTLHLLSGYSVAWSSSNSGVATVDADGFVTGVTAGTATITATAAGRSGDGTAQVVTTASLSGQVAPILKTTCALAFCHRPNPSGGTHPDGSPLPFFDTPANIYAALTDPGDTLIIAGDSTRGDMVPRLKATDATRMPRVAPGDSTPSYAAARSGSYHLITLWIQSGAPNN